MVTLVVVVCCQPPDSEEGNFSLQYQNSSILIFLMIFFHHPHQLGLQNYCSNIFLYKSFSPFFSFFIFVANCNGSNQLTYGAKNQMLASLLITNNHYSLCWNFQSTCNENSLISDHWRMARTSTVTSSTCHFEGLFLFTNPAVFFNIVQKGGGIKPMLKRNTDFVRAC